MHLTLSYGRRHMRGPDNPRGAGAPTGKAGGKSCRRNPDATGWAFVRAQTPSSKPHEQSRTTRSVSRARSDRQIFRGGAPSRLRVYLAAQGHPSLLTGYDDRRLDVDAYFASGSAGAERRVFAAL